MKKLSAVALATWMTVAASPVFAGGFSLNDAAGILNQVQGGNSAKSDQTVQALALLNKAQQMGVKPEQAAGGVGAMLSLAKNQLTTNSSTRLTFSGNRRHRKYRPSAGTSANRQATASPLCQKPRAVTARRMTSLVQKLR